jgi:uncharacterized membrane protein
VESYHIASDYASSFINARGAFLIVKLYDVLNRVREVVVHGAHYGAIVALAAAQISTGHALHFAPQQILQTNLKNTVACNLSTLLNNILCGNSLLRICPVY